MARYSKEDSLFPDVDTPGALTEKASKKKTKKASPTSKAVGVVSKAEAASILAEVRLKASEATIAVAAQKPVDANIALKELNTLLDRFSALLD